MASYSFLSLKFQDLKFSLNEFHDLLGRHTMLNIQQGQWAATARTVFTFRPGVVCLMSVCQRVLEKNSHFSLDCIPSLQKTNKHTNKETPIFFNHKRLKIPLLSPKSKNHCFCNIRTTLARLRHAIREREFETPH